MSDLLPLLWLPGLVMFGLAAVSAFCSGSETAIFYLSPDELRAMRSGSSREQAVAALLAAPERLLTGLLFWNLTVNMTYFAVSGIAVANLASAGHEATAGAFGVVSLAGIILFGEVLPKSAAVVFRRPLATFAAWPLAAMVRLVDPIAPPLAALTAALRRAFWPKLEPESFLDAADLERAVEASTASREVVLLERQVLHNVLDLSEIRLEEAMRPRGSYRVMTPPVHRIDLHGPLPPGGFIALREADSDDVDRIVALPTLTAIPERHVEAKAVDLVHLPWSATLAVALQSMRSKDAAAISVVNEHGETIGILTRDDLLDALLLPEADRAKRLLRRDPILEVGPGVFHVEGVTKLRHLAVRLGLDDYEPDDEENVTIAGLLAEELEHVPEAGETMHWHGWSFKVIDVDDRTLRRVLAEKTPEPKDVDRPEPEA
ncbi:MAG: CNNM domain-containing protein [Planctomycetaceae bacterium]